MSIVISEIKMRKYRN